MMPIKKLNTFFTVLSGVGLLVVATGFSTVSKTLKINHSDDSLVTVPLGGNAWRNNNDTTGGKISNTGIVNWNAAKTSFTAYVRFGHTGNFKLYLDAAVPSGKSRIAIRALNVTKTAEISGGTFHNVYAGEWHVQDTGYVAFTITGIAKSGNIYADIRSLKVSGDAADARLNYVKNNEGDFFYWGRRGPSVHLGYTVPENINAEWFYNEVTVPKGNDVLGSYFMVDGFGEGYFGMQVNSPAERHILFSVWSPFKTDDPKAIPEDQKIIMLKKGKNVHAGEFGNEGSGGQSYMNFMWKAGNTYRFLMHAKPNENGRTVFTAYFYAPEAGKWQLIASFSRPHTNTYLKHLHSFLENFEPEEGTHTREVFFNNEWICDSNGNWTELNKARFTGDDTAIKGYRMDYAGGINRRSFYLKNCGFFNKYTPGNTFFDRPLNGQKPDIDLVKLP